MLVIHNLAVFTLLAACGAAKHEDHAGHHAPRAGDPMKLQIPESMKVEHAAIHGELVAATKLPGRVGEAARELAKILHPHFVREEQIALPPLALLRPLSMGESSGAMSEVLPLTDALRAELPQMLREHQVIAEHARRLEHVAREENNPAVETLAKDLQLHARSEEEIFYPAAMLVGDLVRTRTRK